MMRNMAITLNPPLNDDSRLLDSVAEEFRQGFAELTNNAEQSLAGSEFIFSRYGKELYPYFTGRTDATEVPGCIISIKKGRLVASVDSTCVLIGETSGGALYAARVGAGITLTGSLRKFFRLGPIIVYISSEGVSGLRTDLSSLERRALLFDHSMAERVIRNTVERKVIRNLLSSEKGMIVMADGSLKHPLGSSASDFSWKTSPGTCLVGFSKSSSLIFSESATRAVSKAETPAYYVLDDGPVKTVLAKFSPDGLVFRLDLAQSSEPVKTVLGRILGNDAFSAGYPESLKVAHHLSVFTRAEIEAVKAWVTRRFRLRGLPTFDLRRIALGAFNGDS